MHFHLIAVIAYMLVIVNVSITVVLSNTIQVRVNVDASAANQCIEEAKSSKCFVEMASDKL